MQIAEANRIDDPNKNAGHRSEQENDSKLNWKYDIKSNMYSQTLLTVNTGIVKFDIRIRGDGILFFIWWSFVYLNWKHSRGDLKQQ